MNACRVTPMTPLANFARFALLWLALFLAAFYGFGWWAIAVVGVVAALYWAVVIRGSANVFEANVGIQILDANDEVLVETFTTATCGTGCRGTFRIAVPFEVDAPQQGTIVVHDDDAAGTGTFPHEVRIPVRLLP